VSRYIFANWLTDKGIYIGEINNISIFMENNENDRSRILFPLPGLSAILRLRINFVLKKQNPERLMSRESAGQVHKGHSRSLFSWRINPG
jgi:hypothetical protein